jgi:hypothetical protein
MCVWGGPRALLPTPRRAGVGSYERECRTLYVGYGGAGTLPPGQLRKLLRADFEEWGPIADLHVAADKAIAFVRCVLLLMGVGVGAGDLPVCM